mmetsp:Transcript_11976/g.30328  ORF Transcript_11976/g.30328 Transcript_11976/m.30328 type:complete len:271 (+) Transcript_11976:146-958(+)|eukprot:CAMPEP_0177651200 /NCGR_PEP_ID=MMETSP0447-20121125/12400_1 /TAXON_ID=0 /ORGANISM="Stygamoeba regulata, Strain BSH-02190019" /LENGTH=270 /DNA_ID=CAMNT_0019154223 /DNA_START=63 /DNA_END=875 /DNA_ORIENTATION=+
MSTLVELQLGPDRVRVYRHRSFRRKKKEHTWFNLTQVIALLNRRLPEGGRKLRATSFTLRKRWRANRDYKSQNELFNLESATDRPRKSEKRKPQDTWARWPLVWSVLCHDAYDSVTSSMVCELLLSAEQTPLELDAILLKTRPPSRIAASVSTVASDMPSVASGHIAHVISQVRTPSRPAKALKKTKKNKRARIEPPPPPPPQEPVIKPVPAASLAPTTATAAPPPATTTTATTTEELMWYPPFDQPQQPERLLSRLNVNSWSTANADRS